MKRAFLVFLSALCAACEGPVFSAAPSRSGHAEAGEAGSADPGMAGASGEDSFGTAGAPSAGGAGGAGGVGRGGSHSGGSGPAGGGSGQAGNADMTFGASPYPGCVRTQSSASQCPASSEITFRYECSAQQDPSCIHDPAYPSVCDCTPSPTGDGSWCCQTNSQACTVSVPTTCEGLTGKPFYYDCHNPFYPSPSTESCSEVGGGTFCCSDPYLG